jgi:hypothetical protein
MNRANHNNGKFSLSTVRRWVNEKRGSDARQLEEAKSVINTRIVKGVPYVSGVYEFRHDEVYHKDVLVGKLQHRARVGLLDTEGTRTVEMTVLPDGGIHQGADIAWLIRVATQRGAFENPNDRIEWLAFNDRRQGRPITRVTSVGPKARSDFFARQQATV